MSVQLESRWIAANLGCNPTATLRFKNITTDSRKVGPGSLFVAVPGDKFDGHDFIEAALQSGATGILGRIGMIPAALKKNDALAFFEVADTTEAFRKIAGVWRRFFNVPIVVVAGSVGKTTTKELLTAILRGKFSQIVSTAGSQNGFLGIPITLFDLNESTEIAVVEVGIDDLGAMERHIDLVQPSFALLTSIAEEHLEKLIDLPTVAREERLAVTLTHEKGGSVLLKMDDPWIASGTRLLQGADRVFTCSMDRDEPGDRHYLGNYDGKRNSLRVQLPSGSSFEVTCPLPGLHNAANLLTAISTALAHGLTHLEIQRGLQTFKGAAGRSEMRGLRGQITVLCDYYNANPASVEAGLAVFAQVKEQRESAQNWIVLGDMLELGPNEEELHRGLANSILGLKPTGVFLYGPRMKSLLDELKRRGYVGVGSHHLTHGDLAQNLLHHLKSGDTLFIKGSRGMRMEEVFKKLEAALPNEVGTHA